MELLTVNLKSIQTFQSYDASQIPNYPRHGHLGRLHKRFAKELEKCMRLGQRLRYRQGMLLPSCLILSRVHGQWSRKMHALLTRERRMLALVSGRLWMWSRSDVHRRHVVLSRIVDLQSSSSKGRFIWSQMPKAFVACLIINKSLIKINLKSFDSQVYQLKMLNLGLLSPPAPI